MNAEEKVIKPLLEMLDEFGIGSIGNRESLSEYVDMDSMKDFLKSQTVQEVSKILVSIDEHKVLNRHSHTLVTEIMSALYSIYTETQMNELCDSHPFLDELGY